MAATRQSTVPPISFGTISAVLGSISLMLFFLPILSIPIAVCGLLAGWSGLFRAIAVGHVAAGHAELRWAIIGCAVSSGVVVLGFILAYAPLGELPSNTIPAKMGVPSNQPYVSPPARPH